jgi:GT2 family glycosyltransferase
MIYHKPIVSIIIVNYNTSDLLKYCIVSIKEKTKRASYEIIVIDNKSSDDSITMIKQYYPDILLIESEKNLGFGNANNFAAKSASGKYLFFLNSDTFLRNDALSVLVEFMEMTPNCGICGANITGFEGNPIHSFSKVFPSPFSDFFLIFRKLPRFLYGKNWQYNFTEKPMQVAYITGADLLIRANIFRSQNGFDPEFFMYYEETELTYRVKKTGCLVYNVPAASIAHKKGASLQFLDSTNEIFYHSKYYYLKKIYGKKLTCVAHLVFLLVYCCKILRCVFRNTDDYYDKHRKAVSTAGRVFNQLVRH